MRKYNNQRSKAPVGKYSKHCYKCGAMKGTGVQKCPVCEAEN